MAKDLNYTTDYYTNSYGNKLGGTYIGDAYTFPGTATPHIGDPTITQHGININFTTTCPHMLPCGVCRLTNSICPKHSGLTWNEPYCTTTITGNQTYKDDSTHSYTTDKLYKDKGAK